MASIKLNYKGTPYTLEFNRDSIRKMERAGFSLEEAGNKPMTMLPQLFAGAFNMHHRKLKDDIIEQIYNQCPNKDQLFEALIKCYMSVVEALMDDPDEDAVGNVTWESN